MRLRRSLVTATTARTMMFRSAKVLCTVLIAIPLFAQPKPAASESEVRAALAQFIHAFDNLDWDGFRSAFDDDATVFYPRAFPARATGRAEFEKTFKQVFEQIRNGRTAPPYMDIQPKNLHLQLFGNLAIATFHLDDRPGFLNRRTIVLQKEATGWKIVHLHASEVALPSQHE